MAHSSEGLSSQFQASAAELRALYDGWSAEYDDDVASWGYQVPSTVADMLVSAGVPTGPSVGEVLDAGCGTGQSGLALRQAGFGSVVGVDFSTESLARAANRQVEGHDAYASLAAVDLTAPLPFVNERFIAVGSAGVFTYISDVESTLRELLRITTSGGSIVFSQRTDLWEPRNCQAALERLADDGLCRVSSSEPHPYLPGHPEYGDDIGVIYTQLTAT